MPAEVRLKWSFRAACELVQVVCQVKVCFAGLLEPLMQLFALADQVQLAQELVSSAATDTGY